jgi:membrane associated rhomboid family serine protease
MQVLIGANVALFLAQTFDGAGAVEDYLGLVPKDVVQRLAGWRLGTYMFLHGDLFHILFNMLALWMFGTELERIWGSRYFIRYYLTCGIGAAAITVLFSLLPLGVATELWGASIVGASGAIYGLLLAYALYFPDRQLLMFMIFPMPAKYFVMVIGAIAFYSSMTANRGVANMTHLGGIVVGYLMLKGARLHPLSEAKYWYLRWKMQRVRKKFGVYEGGRNDGRRSGGWNQRVH